ncbi:hypothetical protein [Labrys sp. (in: a-proteobacteria)]|uniref:hypothetical protein n=1 Tax=Labrys sp. (in: a-proteobacteria) TaxID=1917972 RepID=UPI0039E5E7FD
MAIETWPTILVPRTPMWFLKPMIQQGPSTFSGRSQKGAPSAGYWIATLGDILVNTSDRILELRALVAALEGGLGRVLIGPCECGRVPRPPGWPRRHIPFSDQSYFDDGAGFQQSGIAIEIAAPITAGSTRLEVNILQAGELRRGMYFSIDNHLHIITSVPDVQEGRASFSFLPPARAAAEAGAEVEFARPRAVMRLSKADTGQLSLDMNRRASPTIELEEAFDGIF